MDATSWQAFYKGDGQSVYALVVVPLLFLAYRARRGRPGRPLRADAAAFVDGYAVVFAVETVLDAVATTPLARALGIADGPAGTALMVCFVLLGDWRVYLLVFAMIAIANGRRWPSALAPSLGATLAVPVAAYAIDSGLHALVAGLGDDSIWMVYESLFAAVALGLRRWLVPSRLAHDARLRAYLRLLLLYVFAYYALWVAADVIIQVAGLDAGWLLRVVPNQLYYAFWVPLVFAAFFSRR